MFLITLSLAPHGVAALAFLYKIWRILQADRKEDNLDNAERSFRDEIREELREIKEDKRKCEEEKHLLTQDIMRLQKDLAELQANFKICSLAHPPNCPLLNHLDHL